MSVYSIIIRLVCGWLRRGWLGARYACVYTCTTSRMARMVKMKLISTVRISMDTLLLKWNVVMFTLTDVISVQLGLPDELFLQYMYSSPHT